MQGIFCPGKNPCGWELAKNLLIKLCILNKIKVFNVFIEIQIFSKNNKKMAIFKCKIINNFIRSNGRAN